MSEAGRVITVQSFARKTGTVATHQRRANGGRPRVAAECVQVTLYLPAAVYDRCCHEAIKRDVPLAQVLRECILRWDSAKPPQTCLPR